jgi:leucyl-tRNA synthetase
MRDLIMINEYNFKKVEAKWQKYWYDNNIFAAKEDPNKEKFYALIEFPYPSGSGLHVGHIRAFSSMEVIARKKRLEGYSVLFPIGYDAFGLPTENYALQTKQHPRVVTDNNIKMFEKQLKSVGYSFDWNRVVDTTDPSYYKWTQWIFIQLFKKGLAYKSKTLVNFCPDCKVVLANEESQGGICDRCGSEVVQKEKEVWFLKIRNYAESLLSGLPTVNFPDRIKTEQENWIGKSNGADVTFKIVSSKKTSPIVVYTTRPDTIYGVTFLVISPEHPILDEFGAEIENLDELKEYQAKAKLKKELERTQLNKDKTGLLLKGLYAVNPITGTTIPVFTADYVMMDYGTGAIMAVPAHDKRDWDFAKAYDLPIIEVIKSSLNVQEEPYVEKDEEGILVNSPLINGLTVPQAISKIIKEMAKLHVGYPKTDYKMKDWAFNRQRYWGEPIPIINCPSCGQVPIQENELPLVLPDLKDISPTDDASSPLKKCADWVNTTCPICGGPATRETDTMPQWAGSSWYFLRYMSPHDSEHLVNPNSYSYWGQVDWYNGGMEHVTRHLIYSRFWNQFLFDIGVVTHKEPYIRRSAQGLILGADGEKMSKSRGNVVNPDDVIKEYGADVLRLFILFIGDYEKPAAWSPDGIKGCQRFANRFWAAQKLITKDNIDTSDLNLDLLIKNVSDDYEAGKFNTAIAYLMTALNTIYSRGAATLHEINTIALLLNPVAPHITSEVFYNLNKSQITDAKYPVFDPAKIIADEIEIPVQIMGKLRARVLVPTGSNEETVMEAVKQTGCLEGKSVRKVIFVKDRIINIIAN